jgi:hypothetical protein
VSEVAVDRVALVIGASDAVIAVPVIQFAANGVFAAEVACGDVVTAAFTG